ncbi:hypothetical protein SAMN05216184_101800 [Georgenia satyanarayanai]|uniref:DUF2231 domain-containing protein n=1 Tax=Georgenia satyanarayanai TaxID=860221 RepID=A0A2Y9A024_9MICO|nr:DUF2231 domain-containing protein [Georgenia satyanarayanai]PYG02327.1 hypothetical protein A8987_101800 [Georgenia satyanarayanai]SSA37196.1 hypothetical protein SAMN05216184_101800 [Georgenia satyanarayanai]
MTAQDSVGARLAAVVEKDERLDGIVSRLTGPTQRLIASPGRRDLLLGKQLGHALHPILTDLPIGLWASSVVLDVTMPGSRPAARRLVGLGVLAAVPTAVTGWAEWARTGKREDRRTGVVHAAANGAAAVLFGGSYLARRSGRHGTGVVLSQLGTLALGAGGALGGHLAIGRKVGSSFS